MPERPQLVEQVLLDCGRSSTQLMRDSLGSRTRYIFMNAYNFTDRSRLVIQMAREEAARLQHEYVGTEHLLLGLIAEGEGVALAGTRRIGAHLYSAAVFGASRRLRTPAYGDSSPSATSRSDIARGGRAEARPLYLCM